MSQLPPHNHDGLNSDQINFFSLLGFLPTYTDSTTVTNVKAAAPNSVAQQIFIDTSTGTKKLYIYDTVGKAWLSCTIS